METYLGEVAALGTALCFAVSSLSFGFAGRKAGGLAVNQFRILLATLILFFAHAVLVGSWWPQMSSRQLWLLVGSGVVGLTIGDRALFHAFAVIGPRLSSVLMATWPSMALFTASVWHGQVPGGVEFAGVSVTTVGVVLVLLRPQEGSAWNPGLTSRARTVAVIGALIGALGQAVGYVMAGVAMAPVGEETIGIEPLSASVVRMVAGCGGVILAGLLGRQLTDFRAVVRQRVVLHTVSGTLLGPVLGIWLSLVAVQHIAPGKAGALIVTTPLFLLPISWFAYRARIGWWGLAGTLMSVAGAVILMWDAG